MRVSWASYNKNDHLIPNLNFLKNTLVSTSSRKINTDNSMSVNSPLTISYVNSINRGASPALLPPPKSPSFSQTPTATQSTEENMSAVKQPTRVNMLMLHSQGIKSSAKPILKSLTILYNNNQLTNSNLWNSLFTPVSLLRINEFLSSNIQNITCLLLRIKMFIK